MEFSTVPFISVLMVTYNSSAFVTEAIGSVLAQTDANFELVICDDNSTDNTWDIINSFKDERIKASRNDKNLGEYQNRNKAIATAKGDYVIFVDGDDIIYDYCLKTLTSFAVKYPDCGMILARPWNERIIYPLQISSRQFYCFEFLDSGITAINFTKILFKKVALLAVNCFDNSKIKMGDDYIQYKIAALYPSLVIQDGFSWWRRRSGQASERLVKNPYLFFMDSLQYKLPALTNTDLLTSEEKEVAFNNVYGNYLRYAIRQMLKLRFKNSIGLLRHYPVPGKYLTSVFKKPVKNFFSGYSGENPLKDFGNV